MKSSWKAVFGAVAAVLCLSSPAAAEEWIILGTRALGMGGAGVAVADDATAPHWNPAALTRRPGLDVEIPVGVNVGAEGGIIKTADEVYDAVTEINLEQKLSTLENDTATYNEKAAALQDILSTLNSVPDLDRKGQGALADAYGGLLIRYQNFGFSVAGLGYGAVDPYVNLDIASGWNLLSGLTDATAQFLQLYGVDDLATDVGSNAGHTPSADNQGLADNVQNILEDAGISTPDAEAAAEELVWQAEQAELDLSDPTIQTIIQNIAQGTGEATAATGGTGGASALANTNGAEADVFDDSAGVVIKALQIVEYCASYARSFYDEKLAVGVNLKALEGETRYRKYSMRDLEKGEDLIDDITDEKNTKTTSQFDADIGILYTPFEKLSVGLTAKHLASPEFEFVSGSGQDPVKLEPQVRFGVALRPFKSVTLAADTDLTTNESEILDGYKSRQVGVGLEWRPFGFIALRVGGYNNMESDETGWIYTGGLGLRIWKLGFDVSGAMAAEEQEIGSGEDRTKIRDRYSFAAALKFSTAF